MSPYLISTRSQNLVIQIPIMAIIIAAMLAGIGCSSLSVSSNPPGAHVYTNNVDTGMITPTAIRLSKMPVGRTEFSVAKDGCVFIPEKQEVEIGSKLWSWSPIRFIKHVFNSQKVITKPVRGRLKMFETPREAITNRFVNGKEILIFEGDTSRAYTVLGSIEYKHDKAVYYGNTLELTLEAQKLVKDGLKRVAVSNYGDKVDAIINVKMDKGFRGDLAGAQIEIFGLRNTIVRGVGVAVAYNKIVTKDADAGSGLDEIKKAKALLDAGAIDANEYEKIKNKAIERYTTTSESAVTHP